MIIFSPNTTIRSADVNSNFTDSLGMSGEIRMYGGVSAPSGWLLCQGQAISRTTYSALFGVISTTFGVGDGSSTFNLPNMQDKVPLGKSGTKALGSTGGEAEHTLSIAELASHAHNQSQSWEDSAGTGASTLYMLNDATPGGSSGTSAVNATDSTGSGTAHNNLQPYVTVNFVIKY